jgi:hypothetical protein
LPQVHRQQKKWLSNEVNATARNVKRTDLAVYIEGKQGEDVCGQLLQRAVRRK